MRPEDVYWDKPDLADDLREMGDNLFPGMEHALRRAMLYSAAKRIETLETDLRQARELLEEVRPWLRGMTIEYGAPSQKLGPPAVLARIDAALGEE